MCFIYAIELEREIGGKLIKKFSSLVLGSEAGYIAPSVSFKDENAIFSTNWQRRILDETPHDR